MNFILYEDEKEYIDIYKKVIYKLVGSTNYNYKIIEINKYDKEKIDNLEGNKIYILDVEVPGKLGIELARDIRNNGDWVSPIIMITSHNEFMKVGFIKKILMLNFISKNDDFEKDLYDSLNIAIDICKIDNMFKFTNRGEIYQIPYNDILYFEKSLNGNNSIIVTRTNKYELRRSIKDLEENVTDINFFKTHRSCIVNLRNVTKIDFDHCIIYFNNDKIDLLSRNYKKKLKDKMKGII